MNKRRRELITALAGVVNPVIAARDHRDRLITSVPGLAVRNATGDVAEIMIYGTIGGGGWFDEGITSSDIAATLAEITAGRIVVRINSGGGDMFEGTAIYTQLVRHAAHVTTSIDGIAGSAASVIAMAGDTIEGSDAGVLMIHDASTVTYGNGADHRETADLLDKLSDIVAGVYANRAGEDVEHWRTRMSAPGGNGTWYTMQEAYDAGLIDQITGDEQEPEVLTRARNAVRAARLRVPESIGARLAAPIPTPEPAHELDDDEQPPAHEQVIDAHANDSWAFALMSSNL